MRTCTHTRVYYIYGECRLSEKKKRKRENNEKNRENKGEYM